jgi:CrcB protein
VEGAGSGRLAAMRTVLGIAVAGALGALTRYGLGGWVAQRFSGAFPWGTFVVNITGAFALGFLFTVLTDRFTVEPWVRTTLMVGFLGAYTTFSTFSLETVRLFEEGAWAVATANAVGSLVAGILAVYAGIVLGRVV